MTIAGLEKRAGGTSPVVVTGTRIITGSGAVSVIAIVSVIGTETGKERGKGSIATASLEWRWV